MTMMLPTGLTFGEEHFGKAQLGDERRRQRLVRLAEELTKQPEGTLPDKLPQPKQLKACYRLMNHAAVTHAAVLAPHQERTLEQMRTHQGVVLVLHDTTELDYSGLQSLRQDLGQIGNGGGRGYLCHNSLAVAAASREVFGLAHPILHKRPKVSKKETKAQRAQRPNRESRLWKRAVAALPVAPAGQQWVDIADRGADSTELLDYEVEHQRPFVVRSQHNRRMDVVEPDGTVRRVKLHDLARALPRAPEARTIAVPPREGRPGRKAQVRVAWSPFRLVPPRQPRGEERGVPLDLWVVGVREGDPPAGLVPVEWILLTNVPVRTVADAWERVDWYATRWVVEEYHKGLKTGCGIEKPQFTTTGALEPMIGLLSVVAIWLFWLRSVSRTADAATRPATDLFPAEYVEVLSQHRDEESRPLTLQEFCLALARLGGHQNRKHDRAPGWIVLWRGWMKLELLVAGARTVGGSRSG